MYRDPDEDPISFGDIFESEHLIDVYAAGETRALGGGPMDRRAAKKIAEQNNREFTDLQSEQVPLYTPAMAQHPDSFDVLARGSNMKLEAPNRAILLADSCAVDTALVRDREGRRKRGRVLFAPVVPAEEGEVERLTEHPQYGRFPLASCETFEHGAIAELRYCFMFDVRVVNEDDRILALDDEALEDLEVAFTAHALRRGPLATERNVERLAAIVAAESDPSKLEGLAETIGEVLNIAWRLEGSMNDAAESPPLDPEKLDRLAADLHELEEAARAARERLTQAAR